MTAEIKNIVYDEGRGSSDAIFVVIIRGTSGDTKAMFEKIKKLETRG